ncbi:hypothetical protein KC460_02495 [Candidatus Dependentiae bacterium]|nr:hypothetical protein [Candidatus Dependentiae bacterium]
MNSITVEKAVYFPSKDTNNILSGFGVLQNGFTLEDMNTTCSLGLYFPVSGTIALNGGSLYLTQDLLLRGPVRFGAGYINGNNFAIEFPTNASVFEFPASEYSKQLNLVATATFTGSNIVMDWSYDGSYLAISENVVNEGVTLKIFSVEDNKLSLVVSKKIDCPNGIQVLCWHPSEYIFVLSEHECSILRVISFDSIKKCLNEYVRIDSDVTSGLSWSSDGKYLAASSSVIAENKNKCGVRIYKWENSRLVSIGYALMKKGFFPLKNMISWDHTNTYVVVAGYDKKNQCIVSILNIGKDGITSDLLLEAKRQITALAWHTERPLLVVGFSDIKTKGILYYFDAESSRLIEELPFTSLKIDGLYNAIWSKDGSFFVSLVSSKKNLHGPYVFAISQSRNEITIIAKNHFMQEIKTLTSVKAQDRFSVLDKNGKLYVFEIAPARFVVEDAKLFFRTDVFLEVPIIFYGHCILNGGGNIFDLGCKGAIQVGENSKLVLENAILTGVAQTNIKCLSDTGVLVLRDLMWLQDNDFTFSTGKLCIKNRVTMEGNSIFAYCSNQRSLILPRSSLILDGGITFSYDPTCLSRCDLLGMADSSSQLILHGATLHSSAQKLLLKNGSLKVKTDSTFSSNNSGIEDGIVIGTGVQGEDCTCTIASGALLLLKKGILNYNNISADSWRMVSSGSVLKLGSAAELCLLQSLDLGLGMAILSKNAILRRMAGRELLGGVHALGTVMFD